MKNDWSANQQTATRSMMNQPLFAASGVISGADLLVTLSPGTYRFPGQAALVGSGQQRQITIANIPADTYVHLFVRPNGAFVTSGTADGTLTPLPPRPDAEYIASIFTADRTTGNLKGPWNAGAYDRLEQRGQLTACTRPTALYDRGTTTVPKSIAAASSATASGIMWLTVNDGRVETRTEFVSDFVPGTQLRAVVEWMPSGVAQSGVFRKTVGFAFRATSNNTLLGTVLDTYVSPDNADPFNDGTPVIKSTALLDVNAIYSETAGYSLVAWNEASNDASSAHFLIRRAYFVAIPGGYAERRIEYP